MLYIHQKRPKLKYLFTGLLGIYIMLLGLLYSFQERFIFLPEGLPKDHVFRLNHPFEEFLFHPENKVGLNALLIKAKTPKGLLFYHHGNAGNLERWSTIAATFVDLEYDVLVYDYRTYGKSYGKLSEQALYRDAQFLYDFAKTRYNEADIVLYGRSLGTGIASFLASKNNPKSLVLETPYYSLLDVAKKRFPIFPVKELMSYRIPTYQFLNESDCPILVFHGTLDKVVPYSSALKLKNSLSDVQALTFVEILEGSHHNLMTYSQYDLELGIFLK